MILKLISLLKSEVDASHFCNQSENRLNRSLNDGFACHIKKEKSCQKSEKYIQGGNALVLAYNTQGFRWWWHSFLGEM